MVSSWGEFSCVLGRGWPVGGLGWDVWGGWVGMVDSMVEVMFVCVSRVCMVCSGWWVSNS